MLTQNYPEHQKRHETNPVMSIFVWTRGLVFRAKLYDNAAIHRDYSPDEHPHLFPQLRLMSVNAMPSSLDTCSLS